MNTYSCTKCNGTNLKLEERGSQTALVCKDCGAWIEWVGKKEMNSVIEFKNKNKPTTKASSTFGTFEIGTFPSKTEVKTADTDSKEDDYCSLVTIARVNPNNKYGTYSKTINVIMKQLSKIEEILSISLDDYNHN